MRGTHVLVDGAGRFRLSGTAAGRVTLQVSAEGFRAATLYAQWQSAPIASLEVITLDSLNPPVAPLDPGDYTATFSIDLATASAAERVAPCAGFPADMASRSYNATITASPDAHMVRILSLQAPTIFANSEVHLSVGERFIGFEMESPLTEEFPRFRYMNIFGGAPTEEPVTVTDSGISIPIHALFQYCELNEPGRLGWENCQHAPAVRFHACWSPNARMVLSKRR